MSIHSDLMRAATDLLVAVQGESGEAAVLVRPPGREPFRWEGSSVGAQTPSVDFRPNGDVVRVFRSTVQGPTAVLVAHGVTQFERDTVFDVDGREWSLDGPQSSWGTSIVRFALVRKPISRHEEMEYHEGRK